MEPSKVLIRSLWPSLRQSVFWFALGHVLSALAGASELTIMIQPGIDPKRNYELDAHWTAQLARALPPANSPYVMIVQGPDEWLPDERPREGAAEVGALNAKHAEVLRSAMAEKNLLVAGDPLLLAGRVVALLRPMEIDGATAPARHVRFWPLWEVLAYSKDADTLSVALGAVQVLEGAGVHARIARYPAVNGKVRYGVLMPGVTEARVVPWGQRIGPDFLLTAALSAASVTDLQPEDVKTWTWQEVLAPGWSGTNLAGNDNRVKDGPVEQQRKGAALPDLCRQAEALGLECVPSDSREDRAQTLLALSALTVTLLGGWLALRLNRHRLRLLKARVRRMTKKEERF